MHPRTEKWLKAAEYARKDAALVPNHKGTVDKALRKILAENTDFLNKLAGCAGLDDVIEEVEAENAAIKDALLIYA